MKLNCIITFLCEEQMLPVGDEVYSCCSEELEDITTGTGTAWIPAIVDTATDEALVVGFAVACCCRSFW